jgi:hypothetical protein
MRFFAQYRAQTRQAIGFNDWPMIGVGVLVLGFIIPLAFFKNVHFESFDSYWPQWLLSSAHTFSHWMVVRWIIIKKRLRYPEQSQTLKRLLYSATLIPVPYFALHYLLAIATQPIRAKVGLADHGPLDAHFASVLNIALVWAIYECIYMYNNWKASLNETERLKREFVQSQYDSLKSQVNPHFLFNSLNTLVYIIPEDPERGVKYVEQMAKVYRYILDIQEHRLIHLSEELDFLEAYLFLHQERFGNNLQVQVNIPKAYRNKMIVPLSLQLLCENAIKHNIISKEKPLQVEVLIRDEKLVVRNKLQARRNPEPGPGMGLLNIKNRYAFLSEKPVEVLNTESEFVVILPLIEEMQVVQAPFLSEM